MLVAIAGPIIGGGNLPSISIVFSGLILVVSF